MSCDYNQKRREINRLEKCVLNARYSVYINKGESLLENKTVQINEPLLKCPKPAWANG